ncbi:site-specific integrase [bacterium]|nr:site-specific integrase [bacterium]
MATVLINKRVGKNFTSYSIYFRDPFTGEKKYHCSLRRLIDAQKEANELRSLIDSGKLPTCRKKFRPLKVTAVAKELRQSWELQLANNELASATFTGYTFFLSIVEKSFGNNFISKISEKQIRDFGVSLSREKSVITSNRTLFIIKQLFKLANTLNAVPEDFTQGIKYFSEKKHERNRFLLPEQLDSLLKNSRKTKAKFYLPVLILLSAEHGASKQEALDLEWKYINFEYRDGAGLIRLFRTKNMKERSDYIMPRTKDALISRKEHQTWMRHRKRSQLKSSQIVNSSYVFTHLDGSRILSFQNAWRKACALSDLPDFHFHDLRHSYCSNLLLSGATLKDVKDMIGHDDISMTDRYSHLTLEHRHSLQGKLNKHYKLREGE